MSTLSVDGILAGTRELLADPERWMRGDYTNSDETCFCLLGAVNKAGGVHPAISTWSVPSAEILDTRGALCLTLGPDAIPRDLADFNDESQHADVLDLIDRTIARRAA